MEKEGVGVMTQDPNYSYFFISATQFDFTTLPVYLYAI